MPFPWPRPSFFWYDNDSGHKGHLCVAPRPLICCDLFSAPGSEEDEEDDFFDAEEEQTEEFKVCLPREKSHK